MGVDLREVRERGGMDMIKIYYMYEINEWNNRKKRRSFHIFFVLSNRRVCWIAILRAITARAGTCPFLDLWEKQQGRVGPDLWGGPSGSNRYKPGKFHCPKAKREEKVSLVSAMEERGKEGVRSSRVTFQDWRCHVWEVEKPCTQGADRGGGSIFSREVSSTSLQRSPPA